VIQHRKHFYKVLEHFNLRGEVVEVGVAEGNNSQLMASWDCVTKLWMVDNWATIEGQKGDGSHNQDWHDWNYSEAMRKTTGMNVEAIISMSVNAATKFDDNSLIMVYLDADHSYEAVRADLAAWFPKVKTGGIIAGHDYLAEEYGVRKAVDEFCMGRFEVNIIPEFSPEDASFWFQKTETQNFTS